VRAATFAKVLSVAEGYVRDSKALLLRMSLIKHDLVQRGAGGGPGGGGGGGGSAPNSGQKQRRKVGSWGGVVAASGAWGWPLLVCVRCLPFRPRTVTRTRALTRPPHIPAHPQQTVRWREDEEDALMKLVARLGEGSWAAILAAGGDAFQPCRTQVRVWGAAWWAVCGVGAAQGGGVAAEGRAAVEARSRRRGCCWTHPLAACHAHASQHNTTQHTRWT
jgi:hypothetical protein